MTLTQGKIKNDPNFLTLIQRQSGYLLQIHGEKPRLATVFSTQDRWLMGHIGLALHFESLMRSDRDGLNAASFVKRIIRCNVTSRNTATAFLSEMLNYGIIKQYPHPTDRRMRVMVPAPATVEAIIGWTALHLSTLDALDAGCRCKWFQASALATVAQLQPAIAAGLLDDETIRDPHHAFAHFMWMNSGFLITERLIVSLKGDLSEDERMPITLTSVADLTAGLSLSRSHSARKINEAEELGILGWHGTKGRSQMWVSRAFVSSFLDTQAAKLAIIDDAVTATRLAGSAPQIQLP
jgi:hypothetical protein